MELTARIRQEAGMYWAEVEELPGCFASGETVDELIEALGEAVALYLQRESGGPAQPVGATQIQEMKVTVPGEFQPA
jgi:predicted RNase H-like HicB family nuclease